ncbi:MAG: hypothetical protein ACJ8C4_18660 [Gemmataceae bacterium]
MSQTPLRVVENVTCLRCGCLCDDVVVTVDGNSIASIDKACEHGKQWFTDQSRRTQSASAGWEELVVPAVEILRAARCPLIFGFEQFTVEAQREAVGLADDIGGVFDSGAANIEAALFPEQRFASCTWAEVRDRADLLVYWRCRLGDDHWRHEELILEPAQRRGARIVFVDDEAEIASVTAGARYGVVIHEPDAEGLFEIRRLVARLNDQNRFRMISLAHGFNIEGQRQVLCWQTGYSGAVSFQTGYPRSNGREFSAEAMLSRGEVDAVLVGAGAKRKLGPEASRRLSKIPQVVLAHYEDDETASAQVVLLTSIPGIHSAGTVFRSDGLTLPLRPPLSSSIPDAVRVLRSIRESLRRHTV